jgi:hypothetical protein
MRELIFQVNYLKTQLTQLEKLFVWAIIFVSIDGFPFLPLNNENRPLSTIVLLVYWGIQKIKSRSIPLFEIRLWLGLIVLLLFTLIKATFEYHDYAGLFKFVITGSLAVITIATSRHFIKGLLERFSPEEVIQIITYSLILSSIIPLALGVLQFLAIQGLIPAIIAYIPTNFFSYRPLLDRPQLTTTEASHAATYVLIVLFWTYSFYDENILFKRYFLAFLFLMFLFISSSIGYFSFVSTLLIYWLFCHKTNFSRIFSNLWVVVIAGVVMYVLKEYFIIDYTLYRLGIIGDLISNISMDTVTFWLQADYSFLDRFGIPVLGFLSIPESMFLGAGGESFFYILPQMIEDYFPGMLTNEILTIRLIGGDRLTVKFLPAKIASEFGIGGFSLFMWYIISTFHKINSIQLKTGNALYRGLCLCFIYTIISTYMCSYFNFIVILVFVITTYIYVYDTDSIPNDNPTLA